MNALLADLRYAIRTLRKSPGFSVTAILIMALGIGAATAIFSVVNGVLLRPLALPDADRLLALCEVNPEVPQGFCIASPPNVRDWGNASRTLESVGIGRDWGFSLQLDGPPMRISGGIASPDLFPTLGIEPALGRTFREDEIGEGRNHVAVLSHALWQDTFGGDPEIIGRRIVLNGEPTEVVGVLPAGAAVPTREEVRLWKPLHFDPEEYRHWRGFLAVGRMRAGIESATVERELRAVQERLAETYPESVAGWGVRVQSLQSYLVGDLQDTLLFFLAAVGIVLLIACANMANLLLARAARRKRELAVRNALGAGSGRLVRQILTEATVLALVGGMLGLVLAGLATGSFIALAPLDIPRLDEVAIDGWVLLFAVGISFGTALIFGLVPAIRAGRVDVMDTLKQGSRGSSDAGVRTRNGLIVVELALTMALLVDAGLLARSFTNLLEWEPGFQSENLVVLPLEVRRADYTGRQVVDAFEEVERQVEGLPGVLSVGATSAGPSVGLSPASGAVFGGVETARVWRRDGTRERGTVARFFDVSPAYFRTLGLPLLAGRPFDESDDRDAPPVAILNESLASRLWRGQSPLGKEILAFEGEERRTVVGVVGDVRPFDPDAPIESQIYFPKRQFPRSAAFLVVRAAGDPTGLAGAIRDRIADVDRAITIGSIRPLFDLVDRQLVAPRFAMMLVGAFAALALILAAVGIYGALAYTVAQRTREIGIRMALGARRTRVVRAVVSRGLILAGIGVLLGLGLAMLTSRGLAGLLHGVEPLDPVTLAATGVFLLLVATLACFLPARRASRVDPVIALRAE